MDASHSAPTPGKAFVSAPPPRLGVYRLTDALRHSALNAERQWSPPATEPAWQGPGPTCKGGGRRSGRAPSVSGAGRWTAGEAAPKTARTPRPCPRCSHEAGAEPECHPPQGHGRGTEERKWPTAAPPRHARRRRGALPAPAPCAPRCRELACPPRPAAGPGALRASSPSPRTRAAAPGLNLRGGLVSILGSRPPRTLQEHSTCSKSK